MRIAKITAILFAFLLVVMCFNAPVVLSGEEHPWDGDGSGDGSGDDGAIGTDTNTTLIDPTSDIEEETSNGDPDNPGLDDLSFGIWFLLWYYDIPDTRMGDDGQSNNMN